MGEPFTKRGYSQFSPSQLLRGTVLEEHTGDRHLGRFPHDSIDSCLLLGPKRMLHGLPGSKKVISFHQFPMKPPNGSKFWPISEGFRLFSQVIRLFLEPRTMARRPLASSEFSFLATRWVPRWKTLMAGKILLFLVAKLPAKIRFKPKKLGWKLDS